MKYLYTTGKMRRKNQKGFVLVYTLFVSAIMLLITSSISISLIKQIYFSRIARQSQTAYFAADSAIMCTISIDDTLVDSNGFGIFPYDKDLNPTEAYDAMVDTLTHVNDLRTARSLDTIDSLDSVVCAQSSIFEQGGVTQFTIATTTFTRELTEAPYSEDGKTSTFTMRMDTGDGTFRCAKVTVNKTETYRQIISQGYATCDLNNGAVERAIVNVTINE